MRCPKCGYISFDHAESCSKCKKDISGSTEVEGTTYQASAPSFLKIPGTSSIPVAETDDSDASTEIAFDGGDEFDFSDPDLEVLVADDEQDEIAVGDEGEEVVAFEEAELGDAEGDFQIESDDEGVAFDFELEGDDDEPIAAPTLDVPDALADISDLAPPEPAASPAVNDAMSLSLDDEVSLDEDLDLDGLDLDLGLGGDTPVAGEDLSLSLDDISLPTGDADGMGDLSMNLDLGGLDDSPAPKKEKSAGSLDDLSLSLD